MRFLAKTISIVYLSIVGSYAYSAQLDTLAPAPIINPSTVIATKEKPIDRKLCVWDVMANTGEITNAMQNYVMMAKAQGIQLHMQGYIQEKLAIEDFRLGYCDAVVATGISIRNYNKFTGSIEAFLGIPDSAHMRTLLHLLSQPSFNQMMLSQDKQRVYEIAGILPYAGIYNFVTNRELTNATKLFGKKIGIFDFDVAELKIVSFFGAKPYPSDQTNFAQKFINGEVDMALAPLVAYQSLQLYKGIGNSGGILDIQTAQASLQVLLHAERFPIGFAQVSRSFLDQSFEQYQALQDKYKREVNPKHWIAISNEDRNQLEVAGREARHQMVKEGIYSAQMMRLLKRIRCNKNPARAECNLPDE